MAPYWTPSKHDPNRFSCLGGECCVARLFCQALVILNDSNLLVQPRRALKGTLMLGSLSLQGALLLLPGCGSDPVDEAREPTWLDTPEAELPEMLSEVGLYEKLSPRKASNQVVAYQPRAPLWSNGLYKERFIAVPAGQTIDATGNVWKFPENTLLFKTFSGDDGPVETRVVRLRDDGPEFAIYLWDGDDAILQDGERGIDLEVPLGDDTTPHEVPSVRSCQQCHESAKSPVLGFGPTELSGKDEISREQLERLVEAAALPNKPDLDTSLDEFSDMDREVLSYFVGNCVHCHNGSGGLASSFDLTPAVAFDNIIDHPTESSASAVGVRVVPGEPEESILFEAFSGETDDREVKPMPPVGVQRRDATGIELLRSWIESLD